MIYYDNHKCSNVSQQSAVDKVSNIIFSRSKISVLVVLFFSKNSFKVVPFFDSFGFSRYCKVVESWKFEWFIAKCYKVSQPNAKISTNLTDYMQSFGLAKIQETLVCESFLC